MANTTKNLGVKTVGEGGRSINLPVDGGSHLYRGSLISQLTATGMCVPGSTAASGPAIGVAEHEQDNTGADAAKRVVIHTDRIFVFANTADAGDDFTETDMIGSVAYMLDDHTVQNNDEGGTLKPAGLFMGMEEDGGVRVLVTAGAALTQAEAIAAVTMTLNAGTANGVTEAIPNPADAPATADALRDDLVANALPAIRNNIADVGTRLNEVIAALKQAGVMAS